MKAIAYLVALLVAGAGWLGAQDTAHPPAPPTPPRIGPVSRGRSGAFLCARPGCNR